MLSRNCLCICIKMWERSALIRTLISFVQICPCWIRAFLWLIFPLSLPPFASQFVPHFTLPLQSFDYTHERKQSLVSQSVCLCPFSKKKINSASEQLDDLVAQCLFLWWQSDIYLADSSSPMNIKTFFSLRVTKAKTCWYIHSFIVERLLLSTVFHIRGGSDSPPSVCFFFFWVFSSFPPLAPSACFSVRYRSSFANCCHIWEPHVIYPCV